MIQYRDQYFFFNTTSVSNNWITAWVLGGRYDVITELDIEGIRISRTSHNSLTISLKESSTVILIYIDVYGLKITVQMSQSDKATTTGLLGVCNVTAAIQYQYCDNVDICAAVDDQTVTSCKVAVSKASLSSLLARYASRNQIYDQFAGEETVGHTGICLYLNDSGIYKNSLTLPSASFTLDLQIKPVEYSGVILSTPGLTP